MIEMKVSGVILDSASRHPIVMLRDLDERRALLIWIGEPEANAILMALEGIVAPRPLTHDLAVQLLEKLGASVHRVLINDMRDQTFFAILELKHDGKTIAIDARPSDAIALGLRAGAPILVASEVIQANAIPINPAKEEEDTEKFREFLQNLKPGDFGKFKTD